jgi:DNA topoisomerase-3
MLDDRPKILKGITHLFQRELAGADLQINGRAYDDSKITAHHAIIPTGIPPRGMLSPVEQRVYQEITRNWIAQMYPDAKYQDFMLDVRFSGTDMFSAKTSVLTAPGWRAMHGVSVEESDAETTGIERKAQKSLGTKPS